MPDFDVIVIGAGCGGLGAGPLLAEQSRRVLVLNQNDTVGRCASSFERDVPVRRGRVHLGRSAATRTFAALGTRLEDELDLVRCDPTFTVALGTAAGSVPGVDGRNR